MHVPPPPKPCIDLPTSSIAKFFAVPANITPTKNRITLVMMTGIRPNIWLNEAELGCTTVEQRRKDVPAQKDSIAVPWSFRAMVGRATARMVPSRATMSVKTASADMAR